MTIDSFHKHIRSRNAPPPRTMKEEEKLELQQLEVR